MAPSRTRDGICDDWFREAGFGETRVTTSTVSYTDPSQPRDWGDTYA